MLRALSSASSASYSRTRFAAAANTNKNVNKFVNNMHNNANRNRVAVGSDSNNPPEGGRAIVIEDADMVHNFHEGSGKKRSTVEVEMERGLFRGSSKVEMEMGLFRGSSKNGVF